MTDAAITALNSPLRLFIWIFASLHYIICFNRHHLLLTFQYINSIFLFLSIFLFKNWPPIDDALDAVRRFVYTFSWCKIAIAIYSISVRSIEINSVAQMSWFSFLDFIFYDLMCDSKGFQFTNKEAVEYLWQFQFSADACFSISIEFLPSYIATTNRNGCFCWSKRLIDSIRLIDGSKKVSGHLNTNTYQLGFRKTPFQIV